MLIAFPSLGRVGIALLIYEEKAYWVNSKVHANSELVLDSFINLFFHLVSDVLVFVGCTKHFVDLAILTV